MISDKQHDFFSDSCTNFLIIAVTPHKTLWSVLNNIGWWSHQIIVQWENSYCCFSCEVEVEHVSCVSVAMVSNAPIALPFIGRGGHRMYSTGLVTGDYGIGFCIYYIILYSYYILYLPLF